MFMKEGVKAWRKYQRYPDAFRIIWIPLVNLDSHLSIVGEVMCAHFVSNAEFKLTSSM